jgi:hypothetical protein
MLNKFSPLKPLTQALLEDASDTSQASPGGNRCFAVFDMLFLTLRQRGE